MKKILVFACIVAAVLAMIFIGFDITKKEEQRIAINTPRGVPEDPSISSQWKQFYPKQYETWTMTKKQDGYVDLYDEEPLIAVLRAGKHPTMGTILNGQRGHWHSPIDLIFNIKVNPTKGWDDPGTTPAKCIACHNSDYVRLTERDGVHGFFSQKLLRYATQDNAVAPLGCVDCHDPKTMELRATRHHLNEGLKAAGMPTFENSTHQQKRSLVCAQCHTQTISKFEEWVDANGTKQKANYIFLPWKNGLSVEEIESYLDDPKNFPDNKPMTHIVNKFSKANIIIAEHAEFEVFQKGTHAKNGVACADCHMPYTAEGGVKFSHHKVGNPLEMMDKTCPTCHPGKKEELTQIVKDKKSRTDQIRQISLENLAKSHLEAAKAWEVGASEEEMKEALALIGKAQWRWMFVGQITFGAYFHATEETLRVFASANDYAMKARLEIAKVLANHGVKDYKAPEFKNQAEILEYMGTPDREAAIKEKCKWDETIGKRIFKEAFEKGRIPEDFSENGVENWYDRMCK